MARRRWTTEEAIEYGSSLPIYTRRGRRLLTRAEWEQLGRWRRFKDRVLWLAPRKDGSVRGPASI